MSGTEILVEDHAGVRTITLNRPDKLNTFTSTMSAALIDALRGAADDRVRAVLITGAGKGFCAGQDLTEVLPNAGAGEIDLGDVIEAHWNPVVRAIRGLRKPVVAAVNGTAAGAGVNIALACDIVLAARSARFIQPFSKLGLVPDSGGTYFLPRLIGEARAKALMMLGAPITADEAEAWGLIWKALDGDILMPTARTIADNLAAGPTFGFGLMKEAVDRGWGNSLDQQLDLERDLQRRAGASDDYREGVGAFVEKRAATFTGKTP